MNKSSAVPRIVWATIAFAGAVLPGSVVADEQDVKDYRAHIMKGIGEQMSLIGKIMEGRAPAADLTAQTEVLSLTATMAKIAFEQEVQGGQSKPAVWAQWDDFAKRLDDMVAATADLAKAAKAGGIEAAKPKMSSLGCKGCHDQYRVPKK